MMQAWMKPLATDDASLGLEAIAGAGPGGHFFGTAQTTASYETAFHAPMLSNWDNYPTWVEKGAEEAPARPNRVWKECWPPTKSRSWMWPWPWQWRWAPVWHGAKPRAVLRSTEPRWANCPSYLWLTACLLPLCSCRKYSTGGLEGVKPSSLDAAGRGLIAVGWAICPSWPGLRHPRCGRGGRASFGGSVSASGRRCSHAPASRRSGLAGLRRR